MLFDPSDAVKSLMQLTYMTPDFRSFILALGIGYLALAWGGESYIFPRVGKSLGALKTFITRKAKTRKAYKLVLEDLRMLQ